MPPPTATRCWTVLSRVPAGTTVLLCTRVSCYQSLLLLYHSHPLFIFFRFLAVLHLPHRSSSASWLLSLIFFLLQQLVYFWHGPRLIAFPLLTPLEDPTHSWRNDDLERLYSLSMGLNPYFYWYSSSGHGPRTSVDYGRTAIRRWLTENACFSLVLLCPFT